jgi:hypothetical protein
MDNPGSHSVRGTRVVIRSVGTATAGIVGALRRVLPFSEEHLAACLYQAPAELVGPLDRPTAEGLVQALTTVGVEAEVLGVDEPFIPGGGDYDVALVIREPDRLVEVAREISLFLGVSLDQARQILYTSPTELIGKVSLNTVQAIRRRFEPLGVAVDASKREDALFDVFLGACHLSREEEVRRQLRETGLPFDDDSAGRFPGRIAAGLAKSDAEALWQRTGGPRTPLRIVNRDFQRFDLRLDEACDTPEMIEFLVASAGMPEGVARKVPARTPIFTHHHRSYAETLALLGEIIRLGGRASAHLIALQRFRLQLAKIGDADSTVRLLEVLGGANPEGARATVRSMGALDPPAAALQARWLQHELRRVGTEARLVMA